VTHYSEDSQPLAVSQYKLCNQAEIVPLAEQFNDVCLLILPPAEQIPAVNLSQVVKQINDGLGQNATLIILGEPASLVAVHKGISALTYQLWISIKRQTILYSPDNDTLPQHHFGALVYTGYEGTLQHTITRIKYTYCPACDKTTKDYGGKKHTYNSYGTLISDIWRDIACDLEGDLSEVIGRFADLFGLEMYQELKVLDCRHLWQPVTVQQIADKPDMAYKAQSTLFFDAHLDDNESQLLQGDCLEHLRSLPDNSVDFAFIDPPYNLGKNYNNYTDDLSIQEYFSWCDEWINEITRILRPGRTLAVLNIPLWAIRHFLFMDTILEFQNWIAWDALSFPVRKIMPAHYAIVCFSKGSSRSLPGLVDSSEKFNIFNWKKSFMPLEPLDEWYCLRASCVRQRNILGFTDRGPLTDLWWDVHRLKHNSRRVDHPCQLPPQLMYRLISIFTKPDEIILDCFNGAGTTTLCAHQMGRRYIGIELSEKYYQIAQDRHEEIRQGLDPFRKASRKLTEKNSRVPRMAKQTYEVPKKTLQLEVRRVARQLDRLPSREDMIDHGKYPIRYYDEYFASWGEVCAAARHDGMSETRKSRQNTNTKNGSETQQLSLFDKGFKDAKR
jgi:DNA modification methylase